MWLFTWVLLAMLEWCPTTSPSRIVVYGMVARAMIHATHGDPDDLALLASIGSLESANYELEAVGKLGERGVWQLMAPVPCPKLDRARAVGPVLDCEARVALARVHEQGMACYTGECANMTGQWPLAHNRLNRATIYVARHPPPAPPFSGAVALGLW